MKTIWTIIKKDLKRYFTDRRILIALFLPGVMVFAMYSMMGDLIMDNLMSPEQNYTVYTINSDELTDAILCPEGFNVSLIDIGELTEDDVKAMLRTGEADALVKFSQNFSQSLGSSGVGAAPQVEIFYSSASINSSNLFSVYSSTLIAFEDSISSVFDFNAGEQNYDCATREDTTATFITMLMPMLLMLFLWTGCMTITAESIAGEKERGTIATLLVTPVKRRNFAIAKVLGLSITALAGGLCSALGTILSLPNLFEGMDVSASVYGIDTYLPLLIVIITTVLLYNIILLMISTFAKSVKEASSLSSVAMIFILLLGVSGMFGQTATSSLVYLIPIFNSSQCFASIFSLSINPLHIALCVVSNVICIGLGILALSAMFNSEKIMFNK